MRILSIAAVAASLSFSGAIAQESVGSPLCGSLDEMTTIITRDYGEEPVAAGISYAGTITQMFANEETGTWTVLITPMGGGNSCVVDFGDTFMKARVKPDA